MSTTPRRVRTAILISGRGSNMVALIEAAQAADFPAEIVLVAANLPEAGGLERARQAGIATASVDHRPFGKDREAFERKLDEVLRVNQIELVALAGFMRVLTPWFVTRWQGRLVNIHPSLLPDFRGTHTHARALEAGVAEHGCTVHFVVPELDAGPTILQAKVPVLPGDDEASLSARVLEQEHILYPQALALVASGAAKLEDEAPANT
ncbi:MAG: phosphoribosylglycinamide formyltransferase [Bosea sp.]|uniref:phosphoribosylglycinamide formyltransferase n=1 Tax=Bosea sp. (in: a-proteobacteria) TaxID=1871050 RepID=UPI001AC50AA2|nr:phosphoribosylglycinamide formyltransferase [Bosea sp. (in: a-proteobacteria)]MBN9469903.1 phosphoribosylglycinamide formyltransferase [Bosea sp. (in: a-proteobacteria)]